MTWVRNSWGSPTAQRFGFVDTSRMPRGSRATAARSHSSRKARRHCPAISEARYFFGSREGIAATVGDSGRCDLDGDRPFLAGFCNANFAARRRRDCADSITAFWTSLTFCHRRRWPSLIARRPPALNVGMIGPPYAVDADPGSLRRIWRRIWGLLVTLWGRDRTEVASLRLPDDIDLAGDRPPGRRPW